MRKGSTKTTKAKGIPKRRQTSSSLSQAEYRRALKELLDRHSDRLELDLKTKKLTTKHKLLRIPFIAWNDALK
jgi:hypothetical protein